MGHPDVGVALYVYQKLATTCLHKTAACSRSINLVKPDEDEAHSKSCLGITVSDKNVIRLVHLCVLLQERCMHTDTSYSLHLDTPELYKALTTHRSYATQSLVLLLMLISRQ